MQIKLFAVRLWNPAGEESEMNSFLRSHRVLTVRKEFVADGGNSCWAFCVEYLEGEPAGGLRVASTLQSVSRRFGKDACDRSTARTPGRATDLGSATQGSKTQALRDESPSGQTECNRSKRRKQREFQTSFPSLASVENPCRPVLVLLSLNRPIQRSHCCFIEADLNLIDKPLD